MIRKSTIKADLKIESLIDLKKLRPFVEDSNLKINKSQLARELEVDRRTVDKYINGFQKKKKRSKASTLDILLPIIEELLAEESIQIFYYRRILWQYLVDPHSLTCCYSNFCHFLKTRKYLDSYFEKKRPSNATRPVIRFETNAGKQAQLDWKESIPFTFLNGEVVEVNIFVLLLSYSRFRVYRLSLSKSQDILFSFLNDTFETFGGVPEEIVTDNMKTVMEEASTKKSEGKINVKFEHFSKDYGFQVKPCMANRPQTKSKVEAPMKILDEIRAYNGTLDYEGLHQLVEKINQRVNHQVNQGTGKIPQLCMQKEKAFLSPLPSEAVRKAYQFDTHKVTVNSACMFSYKNNQYSVPPEYKGKKLSIQMYDQYIHVYSNTKLVALHLPSRKKLNYLPEHYEAIAKEAFVFPEKFLEKVAKENLAIIGEMYHDESYV